MCSGFFRNLQKLGVEVNKKRVKATSLFNEAAKKVSTSHPSSIREENFCSDRTTREPIRIKSNNRAR